LNREKVRALEMIIRPKESKFQEDYKRTVIQYKHILYSPTPNRMIDIHRKSNKENAALSTTAPLKEWESRIVGQCISLASLPPLEVCERVAIHRPFLRTVVHTLRRSPKSPERLNNVLMCAEKCF
jgi:hypothetical protein